jgi:hypothetical protein
LSGQCSILQGENKIISSLADVIYAGFVDLAAFCVPLRVPACSLISHVACFSFNIQQGFIMHVCVFLPALWCPTALNPQPACNNSIFPYAQKAGVPRRAAFYFHFSQTTAATALNAAPSAHKFI